MRLVHLDSSSTWERGAGPRTYPLGRCLSVAAHAAIFSTSRRPANVVAKSGKVGQVMPSWWRLNKVGFFFVKKKFSLFSSFLFPFRELSPAQSTQLLDQDWLN